MAKIYTKYGDKGKTQLVGGQKVAKSDDKIHAYGTVDELNSIIGIARSYCKMEGLKKIDTELEQIQHWLFDFGSLLAAEPQDREKYKLTQLSEEMIHTLERQIDAHTENLEPLKEFILPGGALPAAFLHQARTVARRAERLLVSLNEELPDHSVPFINRLSDYFFVAARAANNQLKVSDTKWKKS